MSTKIKISGQEIEMSGGQNIQIQIGSTGSQQIITNRPKREDLHDLAREMAKRNGKQFCLIRDKKTGKIWYYLFSKGKPELKSDDLYEILEYLECQR